MRPADQHAHDAARFGDLIAGADRAAWSRPSPVPEWRAIDIVAHLVEWLPGLLTRAGVPLTPFTAEEVAQDPATVWHQRTRSVQQVLQESPDTPFDTPMPGVDTVGAAIDRFYTADIWMHSWDLGEALGVGFDLGDERAAAALAGMEPIETMLRESGQFGPRVPVPDDAGVQDRFMAFLGRDPDWRR